MGILRLPIIIEVEPRLGYVKVVGGKAWRGSAFSVEVLASILNRLGLSDGRVSYARLGMRGEWRLSRWALLEPDGREAELDGRWVKLDVRDEWLVDVVERCRLRCLRRGLVDGTLDLVERECVRVQLRRALMVVAGVWLLMIVVPLVASVIVWGVDLAFQSVGIFNSGVKPFSESLGLWWRMWAAFTALTVLVAAVVAAITVRIVRSLRVHARGLEVLDGRLAGENVVWSEVRSIDSSFGMWVIRTQAGRRLRVRPGRVASLAIREIAKRLGFASLEREIENLKRGAWKLAVGFAGMSVLIGLVGAGAFGEKVRSAAALESWRAGLGFAMVGVVAIAIICAQIYQHRQTLKNPRRVAVRVGRRMTKRARK